MKIIHLSDIHCNGKDDKRFAQLTDKICQECNPDECVVCITGDFVDDGTGEDAFVFPLLQVRKLREKRYIVLAVPGNHDYGGGSKFDRDVKKRVAWFKNNFFDHQRDVKDLGSPDFYPNVDIVGHGDNKIAFLGLDSNEGELDSWYQRYGADGRFGKAQLSRLKRILYEDEGVGSCRYRVLYFHHHASECVLPEVIEEFHELQDRKELGKLIIQYHRDNPDRRIDALLYGHEHYFNKEEPGLWGVERCYDAGSSTGKVTDGLKKWYLEKYKKIPPTSGVRVIDLAGVDDVFDWLPSL